MTEPTVPPGPAQRQGNALCRVQMLAAEQREIERAGPEMFLDGGGADPPVVVWQQRLTHLEAERVAAERAALLAGADPNWVEDARELGYRTASAADRAAVRQHPHRATGAQEFFLDMLEVDLWRLEWMAAMDAARTDRLASGRWAFADDPVTQRQFYTNMHLRQQRLTVLAAAAGVNQAEGQALWGASVEGIRRVHTVAIAALDDSALAREWNTYAATDPGLRVPPYVASDPDTGAPTSPQQATPPSVRDMLVTARSALHAEFVETALDRAATTGEAAAIAASVDAALGPRPETTWEPDPEPQIEAFPFREWGFGIDP
ncbi:hypothetical protein ACFYTF_27000 [Nocardia thailandica]|uniref:Uncharacterized protein n=1 Tax=Nocardia thailandica TaxID=257275 RepID=A0ABW6PVP3_9NOCA